jgi:hypothetical protein
MATIRILATVCMALFAVFTLPLGSRTPAAAQTAAEAPPGRPLNLLPQVGKAKKFTKQTRTPSRVARAKTIHRVAQRPATPARTFARRQNARAVAGRDDDRSATPDQDSLGYQAESRTEAPVDSWLRSPLPAIAAATAAAPAIARAPAAAARDRLDTTAEVVTLDASTAATRSADIPTADITTPDLTAADTFQVADAGEINEIDLAANDTPALAASGTPAPVEKSWLNSLLAVLGGAFAAAAAASFLFARRRPGLRPSY